MNEKSELPYQKIGVVIAVLNALAILKAAHYFLFMAKFPVITWLFFNICVPSVVLHLIGFFTRHREIMAASIPFMVFYGTGGLFTFGWTEYSIIPQIGHILMTSAVIYTIVILILEKNWKLPVIGFIIGFVVFCIILPVQHNYVKSHPEYLKKLGDPKFEKMMKSD